MAQSIFGGVVHFDHVHLGDPEGSGMTAEESVLGGYLYDPGGSREWVVRLAYDARAVMHGGGNRVSPDKVEYCTTFGPPKVWVSEITTHFKNRFIVMLAEALNVDHHFATSILGLDQWDDG